MLRCFVIHCHPRRETPGHKGERPHGTKEKDPRAQRNVTPWHKGPIHREAGGPTGTGGSGGAEPPSQKHRRRPQDGHWILGVLDIIAGEGDLELRGRIWRPWGLGWEPGTPDAHKPIEFEHLWHQNAYP